MRRLLPLAALLTLAASPATAQFSTGGMTLRPHLVGVSWSIDDTTIDAESGGGFGVGFDYGFSELVAAYVELSGATIDDNMGGSYVLAHFDLGARFTFGNRYRPLRFTANAAFSGRAAEIDLGPTTLEASGGGFTVGGGVMYSLSRFLAVDFNLQYMGGEIDEVSVGGVSTKTAVDASSLRAHLGIAWAIGRR